MALSDPFSETAQLAYDSGTSLGKGIESASGSVAKAVQLQNQRKQAYNMLKQFGMVQEKTEDLSVDDLKKGIQDFGKQTGRQVLINESGNPEQDKRSILGIYKALNIPMPKGKTTTTLNLSPGTEYDPISGDVKFGSKTTDPYLEQYRKIKALEESDKYAIDLPNQKAKLEMNKIQQDIDASKANIQMKQELMSNSNKLQKEKLQKEIELENQKIKLSQQQFENTQKKMESFVKTGEKLGFMKEKDKKDNAKLIADAIENGDQLADFQSLYGLAGPVKAELEKRGVNVQKMQLDTLAEKKFIQTLNGPQQTRIRQIIPSITDGLDVLENLNNQFKRTGIKAINKADIEALANGSGTKEQQEIAQKFVTQISVLSDEAGSLFMNGNTPTDKSIELFQNIVKSDFNDTAINAAIKQLKVNLNIRRNAIENVGAVGPSGPINQNNTAKSTLGAAGMGGQSKQSSGGDYKSYLSAIGQ